MNIRAIFVNLFARPVWQTCICREALVPGRDPLPLPPRPGFAAAIFFPTPTP